MQGCGCGVMTATCLGFRIVKPIFSERSLSPRKENKPTLHQQKLSKGMVRLQAYFKRYYLFDDLGLSFLRFIELCLPELCPTGINPGKGMPYALFVCSVWL